MKVLGIVGRKDSGKTHLVVRLVGELRARGLVVSTVKHTHHHDIEFDVPGKDSWRHRQAGASEVLVASYRGWYLAQTTLSFERSNIGGAVGARQGVEDLVQVAKTDAASQLKANGALRHELVDRMVEAGVATQMSLKIISIQAKEGVAPGHEASVAKLYGTELNQRIARTAMKVFGLYGQLDSKSDGVKNAALYGRYKYSYLRSIANTIEGGTSEIQRNITATRGLGLPRA